MNEHKRMSTHHDTPMPADLEDEVLIGRLIDGEAGARDEATFEQRADMKPALWRTLALRQRDMLALAAEVERETAGAARIELPGGSIFPRRLTWPLALSGWAAVLIVGLTWAVIALASNGREAGMPVRGDGVMPPPYQRQATDLKPEALLKQYIETAPWDVQELAPEQLQFSTLDDGSLLIRSMRRFNEEVVVPPAQAKKLLEMQARGETIPIDPIELQKLLYKLGGATGRRNPGES